MNEALHVWRTREGVPLLIFYGGLIVLVSAAAGYAGSSTHLFGGLPLWLRLLPLAVSAVLLAGVLAFRPLRAHAFRLQALSVGTFLAVAVAQFAGKGNSGTLAIVICMFATQYAFMGWQELVAVYGGALVLYAALAPSSVQSLEILFAVVLACVGLGWHRMRGTYAAAAERFALEQQTAELRRQTERSARMAFTDQLTGLLNRAGMNDLIDRALVLARDSGSRTALLYADLDGFKQINDVCGHDAGDRALVEAALRIQYVLRMGESAGRVGGDEFVIVLPSVESIEEASTLAKRIEEAFTEPFEADGKVFSLSASIGISITSQQCKTRLELLSVADNAMYAMKRLHKRRNVLPIAN